MSTERHSDRHPLRTAASTMDSMLLKLRRNMVHHRSYFLLWGWFVFAAFVGQYILKTVVGFRYHPFVWLGLLPLAVQTLIRAKKQKEEVEASVIGNCMRFLWTGLGVSFFVVSLIGIFSAGKGQGVYSYYILLYGVGSFVSGQLLKFQPLAVGGALCWPLALLCSVVKTDLQLLVAAAAILASYIIPAHLLNPHVHSWKTIFRTKKAWR